MNTALRRREDLVIRELDDEIVVFDPRTADAHALNATAAAILFLCDGTRDGEAIAAEIARTFSVEVERARADSLDAIGRLRDLGLLEEGS